MSFQLDQIEGLFPPQLSEPKKGRLRDGLKQFLDHEVSSKNYTDFYSTTLFDYFLQGDLIVEVRFPEWNEELQTYEAIYLNGLIISNSCDIETDNQRQVSKNVMIVKLVELKDFEEGLRVNQVYDSENIIMTVKAQQYSNLFYLPLIAGTEYIAILDQPSSITSYELSQMRMNINESRVASLDLFGFYLFIFKLSYHVCRLPEEADRI